MTPELVVTRLTGFGRGKTQKLSSETLTLGTDAACDIRFDPTWDKPVSARHARIVWANGGYTLEDLGSKNGTWVGGARVTRAALPSGAEIEVGQGGPKIRVEYQAAPAPTAPASRTAAVAAVAAASHAATPTPSSSGAATAVADDEPAVAPAPRRAEAGKPKWVIPALVSLLLITAGVFLWGRFRHGGDDQALAAAARDYANAVGLVVIVHPNIENGKPTPMATAWAVAPRVFATNSHVSTPVRDVLEKGGSAFIVINRQPDRKLKITRAVVHPRYGHIERNFEGKEPAVPAYDVGLLYVDEDAPKVFKLASQAELGELDSGYRIGYLGFPMEGMAGGGVELRSPVATMQSGIITSNTDYWLAQAPFEKRLLVQHSLGAAGGASGSPIFNRRGEVVALLNAGNIIGVVSFETGKVTRAPSGVMVNFAQRVDVLRDIWPDYPR